MSTLLPKDFQDKIKRYPKFKDGRVDYTNERVCPVVNCVVMCGDKVLLTERGPDVIAYPNTWNGVSGFIDTFDSLEKIVSEELNEELCLDPKDIKELTVLDELLQVDDNINREWHVFPVLAVVDRQFKPKTNWENKTAHWLSVSDVRKRDLLPGFEAVLDAVLEYSGKS
jgi:ADP-ribose pyrophosphatase YjhB (NUDIX family)